VNFHFVSCDFVSVLCTIEFNLTLLAHNLNAFGGLGCSPGLPAGTCAAVAVCWRRVRPAAALLFVFSQCQQAFAFRFGRHNFTSLICANARGVGITDFQSASTTVTVLATLCKQM
jgi:hypothetical protein